MRELEINKVYHMDCLEGMKLIKDRSVDMILCDLPYGTTNCKWDTIIPFEALWEQYKRIIKDNGAIVLTASQPFTSALVMSNPKMFKHDWVWHKSRSGSAITAKYRPVKRHEDILVFCKKSPKYNPQMTEGEPYYRKSSNNKKNDHKLGINANMETKNNGTRYPITIQYFKQNWSKQQQIHPTQKPVELFEYLIKTYSNEGDLILDNCMGSFTTAVACINTNRNYIGFELEEKYIKIGEKRLQDLKNN